MIGWLLDTHVVSALANPQGAPSVKAWAKELDEDRLFISVISLAEYDKGIAALRIGHEDRARYSAARDALEARFTGRILSVSDSIVRRWGEISGLVKAATGHPPPVIDTLLSATAIEHRLFLVTRNVRDVVLSGAAIFNPWTDDPRRFPLEL